MNLRRTAACASVLIATGVLLAEEPAPISEATAERIREKLPEYDKEASDAARKDLEPENPDEEVVVLPEMTVIERQQQKMAEEDLYKKGLLDEQLVKKELSEFDRSFLNRYRLPLFGMSNKVRARAIYLERRNREFQESVKHVADNLAVMDPEEAKKLRAELNGWK